MATNHRFGEDDEGKKVVDSHGHTVGIVEDVENETAYVDPDPGITEKIKSSLGWTGEDATDSDTYALPDEYVDSITEDAVNLKTERFRIDPAPSCRPTVELARPASSSAACRIVHARITAAIARKSPVSGTHFIFLKYVCIVTTLQEQAVG